MSLEFHKCYIKMDNVMAQRVKSLLAMLET